MQRDTIEHKKYIGNKHHNASTIDTSVGKISMSWDGVTLFGGL